MKNLLALLALTSFSLASFSADFDQAVNDLIPKLADANVPSRYAAQMQLQDIASNASKPGNDADRAALGKILAAKAADAAAPQPARVWIVRQLEYMGRGEAVEALTQVMNGDDAELRECARRALEKNPDAAASASLRAALQKGGDTAWKTGLINALGQRGDAEAVSLIIPQLADAQVGWAAAQALGRIANASAIEALWAAAGGNRTASEALVEAANRLHKRGDATAASAIYQRLFAQKELLPLRVAALSGLANADAATAAKLITEALTGDEPRLQLAAINVAATAFGKDATARLLPIYPKLNSPAKAQVLSVLDASAEKQVIEAVSESDEMVRRAALEALGRMGSAASVPVLLQALTESSKPGKSTAEVALAKISGEGAVTAIEKAAGEGTANSRAAAIIALATRKDTAALPAIVKYAGDSDSTVKKASFAALRQMGSEAELEPLAKLALSGKSPDASAALEAVAARASDKPGAAKKLLALAGNDEQTLASMLDALSALGGDSALAAVSKLATSGPGGLRDDAVRALGNWTDFAAAKPLLTIASDKDTPLNQYILAMQGVARLVKSAETESAEARVEAALAALDAARRPEEKKLALSTLGTVPHVKAAAAIKPLLNVEQFKVEAGLAGISLAELLAKTDRPAAKDLAQAVKAADVSREVTRRADRILNR